MLKKPRKALETAPPTAVVALLAIFERPLATDEIPDNAVFVILATPCSAFTTP